MHINGGIKSIMSIETQVVRVARWILPVLNPAAATILFAPSKAVEESALDARLHELSDVMRRSAELVNEVEAGLTVRKAVVEKLKVEAETAQRVAALTREERAAVETLLRGTVAQEGKRTLWLGALVNLIFFVAGVLVTVWLGK